jgi:hypothetical protein
MDALLRLRVASEVWLGASSEPGIAIEAALPRLWEEMVTCTVPLTRQDLRAGATLWRAFTSETPAGVERARRSGDASLRSLLFNYARLLPVVEERQRGLKLSLVDRQVLGALSTERWSGLSDLLVKHRKLTEPVYATFGARFLLARLWRWASWRRGAFVRKRLKPGGESLEHAEYLLTSRGAAMLSGSEAPVAPPLAVGGIVVGGDSTGWGCAKTDEGEWRIVSTRGR